MKLTFATRLLSAFIMLSISSATLAQESTNPIPTSVPRAEQPLIVGSPAEAHTITTAAIPQHPFMRADEASNIHDDGYMSDTYTHPGPLGINPAVTSADLGGICATITFDWHGHIITSCLNFQSGKLFLLKADTLAVLTCSTCPITPFPP